jgi:UDP-N-acetylglucosamine 2-epimerase (non-hydrolysing)
MAPLAAALLARGHAPSLVLTDQQPLDPADFGLSQFARWRLGCRGRPDPHQHVHSVTAKMLPMLRNPPDLLIVQGDTSSALGGALAGFAADVPVAHVEAGLRTHDPALPWPEEEYRTAIDAHAELLFAPTDLSARNLECEKVRGEIYVTGNTAIDALRRVEARLPAPAVRECDIPTMLVTCHRRESWGEGLEAIAAALIELARDARIDFILHPNVHVAATMSRLLDGARGITLLAPCSHEELIRRMRDADLILSDSGGIQEEAPALGTPLLVLRDKTERPEGIATGNMRLVGTDRQRIVAEARNLLGDPLALAAMSQRSFPYGDGRAAPRIATIIEDWLDRRSVPLQRRAIGGIQ